MLDHRTGSKDCIYRNDNAGEFVWTRAENRFSWRCVRGDYQINDERIGWFSPARAESLAGVPPTFIAAGGLDLFVDEDIDYARRLGKDGVSVELHIYPGGIHGFDMMASSRIARQMRDDVDRAISVMLGVEAPV